MRACVFVRVYMWARICFRLRECVGAFVSARLCECVCVRA